MSTLFYIRLCFGCAAEQVCWTKILILNFKQLQLDLSLKLLPARRQVAAVTVDRQTSTTCYHTTSQLRACNMLTHTLPA